MAEPSRKVESRVAVGPSLAGSCVVAEKCAQCFRQCAIWTGQDGIWRGDEDGARAFEGEDAMDNLRAHPEWAQ